MGKYFAIVDLNGTHHGLLAKCPFIPNPTTIKFESVSFDGHQGTGNDQLKKNFIILDLLFKDTECSGNYFCDEREWIYKFFKNSDGLIKWNL